MDSVESAEESRSVEAGKKSEGERVLRALGVALIVGILSAVAYSVESGGLHGLLSMVGTGTLLAGASALIGGTLGFLFGIPRTLQQETQSAAQKIEYRVNTNLEQISDWLTKILVGVGLTQISGISEGFVRITAYAGRAFGPVEHGQVFAAALLTYFVVLGFLLGYLWTRLFFVGALRTADRAALESLEAKVKVVTEKAEKTKRAIDELRQQSEKDASALSLAYRQLNPMSEMPEITQEELNNAVAAASVPIKVQLFNQASTLRSENWRSPETKPKMELSIPIFRALIADDSDRKFHRNHGQLGYAFKDQVTPDWKEAERELSLAIEIRGPWRTTGWAWYEFNRAVCRIMLDPDYAAGRRTGDLGRHDEIVSDLRVTCSSAATRAVGKANAEINRWMSANDLSWQELLRSADK